MTFLHFLPYDKAVHVFTFNDSATISSIMSDQSADFLGTMTSSKHRKKVLENVHFNEEFVKLTNIEEGHVVVSVDVPVEAVVVGDHLVLTFVVQLGL